ncbi:MAG: hypothetical protein ACI865_000897 [Flavobacteriaceae bacterium]|jgi:hypothetical protein
MKKTTRILAALCLAFSGQVNAQCPAGQDEVTIDVHTDAYGYEGYWELVPAGNACGVGTIFAGGNVAVGCGGAGAQNQTPGGYGNNLIIPEGPWCLTTGAQYSIIFVDDWGDGGFLFDVSVNGFQIESFLGMSLGGTYTFTVEEPPAYDLSVFNSNLYSYVSTGSFNIEASVFNAGTAFISSYDLSYAVDGGAATTTTIIGSALANFASENVMHSIPLNIPTNGVYTIQLWAGNIEGSNPDMNNANDTLTVTVEAGPGRPNYIDGYIGQTPVVTMEAGPTELINDPTDLDFHPVLSNKELWVVNRGTEASGSPTVTIFDAGEPGQTSILKEDENNWHFMSLTTGIAFSQNGNWGSSPGVFDANHNGGDAFTGPALWSSDLTVYAEPSGGNGSHLDMLHVSPYSQGIAAERDNVFWVFDGFTNDLVRYDFAADHGPGGGDHSDGIIRRYSDDAVAKDPADIIVSHLVMDDAGQWLYAVDHGNQRVIRIDITTGSDIGGAPNYPGNEAVAEYSEYTGYTQETVVVGLAKPAGIDIIGDRMIISEHETGEIIIYDISSMPAVELERLPTGLSSVQGVKIGPEGRIWFVDANSDGVYKIEANELGLEEQAISFSLYPNPSTGDVSIRLPTVVEGTVEVRDITGKMIVQNAINGQDTLLQINAEAGIYFVTVTVSGLVSESKKLMIK